MKLFNLDKISKDFSSDSELPVTGKQRIKGKNRKRNILNSTHSKLNTKDLIASLYQLFKNHKYQISNAYVFDWESDFFSVSESEYVYEVETKISKSDFHDDFNKKDKHIILESQNSEDFLKMPNKFYYCVPKGLLTTFEIPSYAGLIEVHSGMEPGKIVKKAPFLHNEKVVEKYKGLLLEKFAWRYREEVLKQIKEGYSQ